MLSSAIPAIVGIMSGITKNIDANKRRKLGLPPRPASPYGQIRQMCEPCVTSFKEENEPTKTEKKVTIPKEDTPPQHTSLPTFDFSNIISSETNNDTTFGGGSFGGGGASGDW